MSDKIGKIEKDLFEAFIAHQCGYPRSEVIAGPEFGVDVSVVDLGNDKAMTLTSDPLSLIPSLGLEESAWLSVHLMANDMATTGFAPMYGQFVLNLPSTFSEVEFQRYWSYIHRYCQKLEMTITGGHTGFIEGQHSTIAGGGTFISIAPKKNIRLSKYAQPGNVILVTKSCAISSAAILAMSFPETVKAKAGHEIYHRACESFYQTSSLPDALAAVGENASDSAVTALHDVTEGGVLGAIYEMAIASGNGVRVFNDHLPISEAQATICKIFELDPRYCIGAGSMIIACEKDATDTVIARLHSEQIPCVAVGEFCPKEEGVTLVDSEYTRPLTYFDQDPYWAAFYKAIKLKWK